MHPRLTSVCLLLCLFCSGCAHWQMNSLAQDLRQEPPQATLLKVEELNMPSRDKVQFLLNRGILRFYTNDLSGCREDLEQAKNLIAELQAISISENLAAATTNETLRKYSGSASEQVMVHVILALSYLAERQLDAARTEVLQADVLMQSLAEGDEWNGQLAAARFIGGLVYQLGDEPDNAMISYRKALELLDHHQQAIPAILQQRLLKLSQQLGLDNEYAQLSQRFQSEEQNADSAELTVLYLDGIVSTKQQNRMSIYSPQANQMISIAVPHFPDHYVSPRQLLVEVDQQFLRSQLIESIDARVREDLAADMPKTIALATTRAVAKYQAVRSAQQNQNQQLAAALLNIFTVASEQADTRSWNMLPANIQVTGGPISADSHFSIPELALAKPSTALQTEISELNANDHLLVIALDIGRQYYPVVFSIP